MGRVPALVLVGAVVLGACSGDDDGSSASSESTSTADDAASTTTSAVPRGEGVAVPTVEGPVTGGDRDGIPANPAPPEILDEHGYVEEEFFVRGEATSYAPVGELDVDGMWEVEPADTAPYTTRILVRRPADPADANGVVAVEWFNVSGGQDADPDFGFLYPELLSEGTTWVGVSAQFGGVDGEGLGIDIPGVTAQPIKTADPTRYAPIEHPGDDYSYDIYSQAAQALRRPDGPDPLGGIPAEHVVAMGESQSAARLGTYIDAVHPLADIYDGFFVHSRGSGFAPIATDVQQPEGVLLRADVAEPVLLFQTETDVLRSHVARQPDTDTLVTWEVAGTAHADQSQLDYGNASAAVALPDLEIPDFETMCGGTLNQGPQPLVSRRAWSDLVTWVVEGTPPAGGPLLEIVDGELARDDLGIALGGIRTPDVDVPIAVHSGTPRPEASVICSLFGSTTPLPPDVLASRYPDHDTYVAEVRASAEAAVEAGHLLPGAVEQLAAEAEAADLTG